MEVSYELGDFKPCQLEVGSRVVEELVNWSGLETGVSLVSELCVLDSMLTLAPAARNGAVMNPLLDPTV